MSDIDIAVGAPVFDVTLIVPGDVLITCVWCGHLVGASPALQDVISGGAWPVCLECSDRGGKKK